MDIETHPRRRSGSGSLAGLRNRSRPTDAADAAALERLGHAQELQRNFSTASMLGLAFAIVNTWPALAASLNVALPSGGSGAVVWGLMTAGVCNLCLAASLAEFLSAYPTAGGQYHWAAIVAWPGWGRGLSYATGWINVAGWVAVSASGGLLGSTWILNLVSLLRRGYEPQPWHQFLVYAGLALLALAVNALGARLLPLVTRVALYWSIGGFFVTSVAVLACAAPNFQRAAFVYGGFVNDTGWPDGLAWMLGLLQGAFALTGFDATAHMIEEIPKPHIQGPRIMLACIVIGVVTGFVFLSCLLFCLKDVQRVIDAPWGPLLQIYMDATGSPAGSACLLMIPVVGIVFTLTTLMCASSRMSYAFARDRGMPFSAVFARVHPRLGVPLNALLWTAGWVVVFGCIFLGSSSTFNAITAASVVSLGVTYAIPPAVNLARGRRMLPESRAFKLWEPLGWLANVVGILWTVLTTVLFVFPPKVPVTPSNMNYCIVAFGIILLIAAMTWILDGRQNYRGPWLDVRELPEQKVEGKAGGEAEAEPVRQLASPEKKRCGRAESP